MTIAQGQATQANRSRILRSIFARTPRDTSASTHARPDMGDEPSTTSPRRERHAHPTGWRDVATRHARETLAERVCARFFTRGVQTAAALPKGTQPAEFATAGQRLQMLSRDTDAASVGHQNLAAILAASAQSSGSDVNSDDNGKPRADAGLTAKAA